MVLDGLLLAPCLGVTPGYTWGGPWDARDQNRVPTCKTFVQPVEVALLSSSFIILWISYSRGSVAYYTPKLGTPDGTTAVYI